MGTPGLGLELYHQPSWASSLQMAESLLSLHHGESQFLIINLIIKSIDQYLSFPGDSDICLPVRRETQFQSLGQEDTLEKEMATYSSVLAWEISWMEEPGSLQSVGSQSQTRLSNFT